ncbi:transglutaminase [Bacteroidia bacterium]|nr:transglutaminase [Bacteroidia bacterium]
MKHTILILAAAFLLASCGDSEQHFLNDSAYRSQVHKQFQKRVAEASNRNDALFSVFDKDNLSTEQREALEFLYAYMPLSDLADHDGEFFLQHVDAAFAARDYFAWGRTIPDEIFRHFVLVYRVNNEDLDTARMVFFAELKDRVKNLSMYDAALEVNHWCHEKVTYRGTDSRTSAPLALVRTSWGRCGEESAFAAAALRAVGIPARQCYTPRWVHTDDNHAWVEVWIDGKWHYLGACEPEAELDAAWFTGPAKRAMMVHTNVFGAYNGPEEKNLQTPLYSKINLLANYADTRTVKVQVVDAEGKPVENARVQFKVYNYAEFYTIAESRSGKQGIASIISGNGDLLVWASKDNAYGYAQSTPQDQLVIVKMARQQGESYAEDWVVSVPPEQAIPAIAPDKAAANAARLVREDSIRNAYMQTFTSEADAKKLAQANKLDSKEVWKYLNLAQGNWQEISRFIEQNKGDKRLFSFLASLSAKDVRDTRAAVLSSYLEHSASNDANVFSPRIERELIVPYTDFGGAKYDNARAVIDFVKNNITISEDNYYNCRISPRGVYELRIADKQSRNILFTAMCRSAGIPARIEQATARPQYFEDGKWQNAVFEEEIAAQAPKTKITLQNAPSNIVKPGYYSHYTLAYYKDGDFQTLDYENNAAAKNFPYTLDVDAGYYRLMAGSRANDGSVTVHTEYFELKAGEPQTQVVKMPEVEGKLFVKGIVDMNTIVVRRDGTKATLKEISGGKGLILCFVDLGKEPSKHILQDLSAVQRDFEAWGGGVLFMIPSDKDVPFDPSAFKGLPQQTAWSVDAERTLLRAATDALQTDFQDNFPLAIYLSRNGGILHSTEGYRIGTGEAVLKVIRQERTCTP